MTIDQLLIPTKERRASGVWTAFGTFLALVLFASFTGGFASMWPALQSFVTLQSGRPPSLAALHSSAMPALAALTAVSFIFTISSLIIAERVAGEAEAADLFSHYIRGPKFARIMVLLIAEELFARLLFLGVIGHFWQGQVATYALFLAGNGLWAALHLSNYRKEDRQLVRVLPQFVGGIFLTVAFLQYGFFAALLVHIAYDMVLFSTDKRNAFNSGERWTLAYNVITLIAGVFFVGKPLTDLSQWLKFDGSFAIPGWEFWNYVWAIVIIGSLLTIVAELLLFDFESTGETTGILDRLFYSIVGVLMFLGGYWVTGLFTDNVLSRLLVLAIALLFAHMSGSGSNLARTFWISIPGIIVLVCGLLAIEGFWPKVGMVFVFSIINIPEEAIRSIDT